jgi:alpha-aminoadipic semialdehyde synthase
MLILAVREEDKSILERRTPVTPADMRQFVAAGFRCLVEPSNHRVFPDAEFAAAGAALTRDIAGADLILGLKEIPPHKIVPGKVHLFFSHTIKGQPHNMPMLQSILDRGATLVDYERVVDESNRRLIFFGNFAGYAGAIDTLHLFGVRLQQAGLATPLAEIRRALDYPSLAAAHEHIRAVGQAFKAAGIPEALKPLVIGVSGYGNVSKGAQSIIDELDPVAVSPADLAAGRLDRAADVVYKAVFTEADMVRPATPGGTFELQDYYQHPDRYRSAFEQFLPAMDILLNCIYWDDRYPRLFTRAEAGRLWREGRRKLRVVGDITCDIGGSIEFTFEAHGPDQPFLVYDPLRDTYQLGAGGDGIAVLIVDILPSELPLEASNYFSGVLSPFIPALMAADFSRPFESLDLPAPLKRAVIVHNGQLTPEYAYIEKYLHH